MGPKDDTQQNTENYNPKIGAGFETENTENEIIENTEIPTQSSEDIFRNTVENKKSEWKILAEKLREEGKEEQAIKIDGPDGYILKLEKLGESSLESSNLDFEGFSLNLDLMLENIEGILAESAKIDLEIIKQTQKEKGDKYIESLNEIKGNVAKQIIATTDIEEEYLSRSINGITIREILEREVVKHLNVGINELKEIPNKIEQLNSTSNVKELISGTNQLKNIVKLYDKEPVDFFKSTLDWNDDLKASSLAMAEIKEYIGNLNFLFSKESLEKKLGLSFYGQINYKETEKIIAEKQRGILEKRFQEDMIFFTKYGSLPISTAKEVTEELRHEIMAAYVTDTLNSEIENEKEKFTVDQVLLLTDYSVTEGNSAQKKTFNRYYSGKNIDGNINSKRQQLKNYHNDQSELWEKIMGNAILKENLRARFMGEASGSSANSIDDSIVKFANEYQNLSITDPRGQHYSELISELGGTLDWGKRQEFKKKHEKEITDPQGVKNYLYACQRLVQVSGNNVELFNRIQESGLGNYEIHLNSENQTSDKYRRSEVKFESKKSEQELDKYRSREIVLIDPNNEVRIRDKNYENNPSGKNILSDSIDEGVKYIKTLASNIENTTNEKIFGIKTNKESPEGKVDQYAIFAQGNTVEISNLIAGGANIDPKIAKTYLSQNPNTSPSDIINALPKDYSINSSNYEFFMELADTKSEKVVSAISERLVTNNDPLIVRLAETSPDFAQNPKFADKYISSTQFNSKNPNNKLIFTSAEQIPNNPNTQVLQYLSHSSDTPETQAIKNFRKQFLDKKIKPQNEKDREIYFRSIFEKQYLDKVPKTTDKKDIERYSEYLKEGNAEDSSNPIELNENDLENLYSTFKENPKLAQIYLDKYIQNFGVTTVGEGIFGENSSSPEKRKKIQMLIEISSNSNLSSLNILEKNLLNLIGSPIDNKNVKELYEKANTMNASKESIIILSALRYGILKNINPSSKTSSDYNKEIESLLATHSKQIGYKTTFEKHPELLSYVKS